MSKSFASSVKFIPKYFILFDSVVNGIVFVISFPNCLLLVYGTATEFCVLIMYPATLVNLFISSNSFFLVESLAFSACKIMSSVNRGSFTSSFLIWMPFISLSCLISLVRTSTTILNRSGESRHPCLIPDLTEKAISLSPLFIYFFLQFML